MGYRSELSPDYLAEVDRIDAEGLPTELTELMARWRPLLRDTTGGGTRGGHWLDLQLHGEYSQYFWMQIALMLSGVEHPTCWWSSDRSDDNCHKPATVFAEARVTHAGYGPSWWCSVEHAEDRNSWARVKTILGLLRDDGTWDFSHFEDVLERIYGLKPA